MKKNALLIGILVSVFLSFYLLLRKNVVEISDVDFYKYQEPICKDGQLEIHSRDSPKSSFKHHFAFLKNSKVEKIIPLILIEESKHKGYFKPKDNEIGCLKDINYLKVLSFKNKIVIKDLKVIDSKISDMKIKKDEYKCGDNKFVLTSGKLTSKSVDLGGVEMSLFAEREGEIDMLSDREFTVTLNGVPYLFISLAQMNCESMDRGNWRGSLRLLNPAISIINLEESKLVGTKRTGVKWPD